MTKGSLKRRLLECKVPIKTVQEVMRLYDMPYNVTKWKNIGIKRGYWDYFKKQVKEELEQEFRDGKLCFCDCCGKIKKLAIMNICVDCI